MRKGDIVLIPFPFTNLRGTKRRPAVILYEGEMDVIVAFITSNTRWKEKTDLHILPSELNGLKKTSLVRTNKIATLEIDLVVGKIGELTDTELLELHNNLKELLGIQ